jgi:1-acyl-sn-glycerol-3-phosphate acyltransferase
MLVPGALLVANHISWIDIYVINAARCRLPLSPRRRSALAADWLAGSQERHRFPAPRQPRARADHQSAGCRNSGQEQHVAVFPEGTTTDGTHLLHFHAALIQPALAHGAGVAGGDFVLGSRWAAQPGAALRRRYLNDAMHAGHSRAQKNDCPVW